MAETRERSATNQSHQEYLEALHAPTAEEWQRIYTLQKRKEVEIDSKYHHHQVSQFRTDEEHQAATTIQKAYRGHRELRQQNGLTLDPSSRWTELIREMRYRAVTAPHETSTSGGSPMPDASSFSSSSGHRARARSNAQRNWLRAAAIVEHAAEGDSPNDSGYDDGSGPGPSTRESGHRIEHAIATMNLDLRYFLEMVDVKHRYGANLQVYHEEWLRSRSGKNFFYWLDVGEGSDFDLPGCSRAKLDRERVRYLSRDERKNYLVVVDDEGRLRWDRTNELITTSDAFKDSMDGIISAEDDSAPVFDSESVQQRLNDQERFAAELAQIADLGPESPPLETLPDPSASLGHYDTSPSPSPHPGDQSKKKDKNKNKKKHRHHVSGATILNHVLRMYVRPGTWIYVADTQGRLYIGIKSSGMFQHTSFLSGARISSAGSIAVEDGRVTYLAPLSGHYRPSTASFKTFLQTLRDRGADLSCLRVSHAYEILLTMEMYGKVKDRTKGRRKREGRESSSATTAAVDGLSQSKDDRSGSHGGSRTLLVERKKRDS